jgi:hypothetical protein
VFPKTAIADAHRHLLEFDALKAVTGTQSFFASQPLSDFVHQLAGAICVKNIPGGEPIARRASSGVTCGL